MKYDFFRAESYCGYLFRDIGLVYYLSKSETISLARLDDILTFICSNFTYKNRLMITANNFWYRDALARDGRLLLEAYKYTGLKSILHMVEDQVNLWINTVPRKEHNGHLVFPYGLDSEDNILAYTFNSNQNLVIACLFSDLYWNEDSQFYKNSVFKNIVYNEINAALSLQYPDGSLALAEHRPLVLDSNYGGYSASLLFLCCLLWQETPWIDALKKMGQWLYHDFPMNHPWNLREDFPNFAQERFYSSNLLGRIPAFYITGVSEEYAHEWIDFTKAKFPDENLYLDLRFFNSKIPPSYWIKGYDDIFSKIDPPTINFIEDRNIINIFGRIIYKIEFNNDNIGIKKSQILPALTTNVLKVYYTKYEFIEKVIVSQEKTINLIITDYNNKLQ